MAATDTRIRGALAAAVGALLGAPVQAARPPIEIESAELFYAEPNRITCSETAGRMSVELGEERFFRFKAVLDALTGASANGATPSRGLQTFTRPSGMGVYRVQAGDTPLDNTFQDTRFAANASYETPLGRLLRGSVGSNVSAEHDYRSLGLNVTLARDFNDRNTTLSTGVSGSLDTVNPAGGAPIPLHVMGEVDRDDAKQSGSMDKKVLDLLVGCTQVVSRSLLMQMNYSYSRSTGYLTDPYKLLSVVHGAAGADQGEPVEYLYESRPDTRAHQSLYWEGKYTPGEDVLDLSYRYHWDDWGVASHTWETRYRWQASEALYFEPQLRYYTQTEADFYHRFLADTAPIPRYASADYRLGRMQAVTGGLAAGKDIGGGRSVNARLAWYSQSGEHHPKEAIGSLRSRDLFPTVNAVVVQVGYSMHL